MTQRACTLPIVILAAGQSRRMRGRDKLMETVEGRPLIRRQAEIARTTTSGPVCVTLPPGDSPRARALRGCDVTHVPVAEAASGLSASLRAGLRAIPAQTPAAMILLADLPELTVEDLCRVCAASDGPVGTLIWRGTTAQGAPGHPIVFARALFAELMALTGDTGGAEIIKKHHDKTVLIPLPGQRARRDLDTPEDWAAWRAGLA